MDNRLSFKAKGIYAYLFSKPDGWIFYKDKILAENKDSKASFQTGIQELINAGYIKRYQLKKGGKFGGVVYEFVDPRDILSTATPQTENRSTAPCAENRSTVPCTENRSTNNIKDINNNYNYINNNYINNNIINKNKNRKNHLSTKLSTDLSTDLSTGIKEEKKFIDDNFKIDTADPFFNNLKRFSKKVILATEKYFLLHEKFNTVEKLAFLKKAHEINEKLER